MKKYNNTLIELGCEELPPAEQSSLISSFSHQIEKQLTAHKISWSKIDRFTSPRRLALLIKSLAARGEGTLVIKEGPAQNIAYKEDGSPTPACEGFARNCGVSVKDLSLRKTAKGERLCYEEQVAGEETVRILPQLLDQALLPLSKGMRWEQSPIAFIRPVRWLVLMADERIIPWHQFGLRSQNKTYGHRFLVSAPLSIHNAADYEKILVKNKVMPNHDQRLQLIKTQATKIAQQAGAQLNLTEEWTQELAQEIAALTEYPVAYIGKFNKKFLRLPQEVLRSVICGTQKYLMLTDKKKTTLPSFVFIANIRSAQPKQLIRGNEAVITPRLQDATFFYEQDKKTSLAEKFENLSNVAFFSGLGDMKQKSLRTASLAGTLAEELGLKKEPLATAARLCKCDLISLMVQEFPQLQGIMGGYYFLSDKKKPSVSAQNCAAILRQHYLPQRARDPLPGSLEGCALSLSDKLDSLFGLFLSDYQPSGTGDPYGLRRNAAAIVRILIEKQLDVNLLRLLRHCGAHYARHIAVSAKKQEKTTAMLMQFIKERIFSYGLEQGLKSETLIAAFVSYEQEGRIYRSWLKAKALMQIHSEDLNALIELNKRLKNILKEAKRGATEFNPAQAEKKEETTLYRSYRQLQKGVQQAEKQLDYAKTCHILISLTQPLAVFFDEVMVMAEDPVVRNNRLALLRKIYALFLHLGDLTVLSARENKAKIK